MIFASLPPSSSFGLTDSISEGNWRKKLRKRSVVGVFGAGGEGGSGNSSLLLLTCIEEMSRFCCCI